MQLTNTYKNGKEKMMSIVGKLNNAIVTQAIETQNQTWLSISDTVAIVSIVGSLVFMANIFYQFYSSRRKAKCDLYYAEREDTRRQEAHDKAMNNK